MYLQVMQRISAKSRVYLNNESKSHLTFLFTVCWLICCMYAHCVAFQKDPQKGYHWNDPSRHLLIVYL